MEQSPIDNAVILAAGRIFNQPGEPAPSSPLTSVGGLSLFQRTLFTLQRGGISRLVVLAGDEMETLKGQIQGDTRVTADVRWLPIREFSPDDPRTWESISGMFGGSYLITATGAVFAASLIARMAEEARRGDAVVVVRDETMGGPKANGLGAVREPPLQARLGLSRTSAGVVTVEEAATLTLDVNLAAIPEGFFASGWATAHDGPSPLQAALERGLRQGQVRTLPLRPDWYQSVGAEGPATRAQAEWTLLKDSLDGFVGRHFNRPCPPWITRVLRKIVHFLR